MCNQNSNIIWETSFFQDFPTVLKQGVKTGFIKVRGSQKPLFLEEEYATTEQGVKAPRQLGSGKCWLLLVQDKNFRRCKSKNWILSLVTAWKQGSSSSKAIPCFYGLWALASAGTPKCSWVPNQTEVIVVQKTSALPRQNLESRLQGFGSPQSAQQSVGAVNQKSLPITGTRNSQASLSIIPVGSLCRQPLTLPLSNL